jgi:adenosine/AMP kinase
MTTNFRRTALTKLETARHAMMHALGNDEAMPADVMEQIRRSKARMTAVSHAKAAVPNDVIAAVAHQELLKIFAAYEREPAASDPCVKMRAIWGIP